LKIKKDAFLIFAAILSLGIFLLPVIEYKLNLIADKHSYITTSNFYNEFAFNSYSFISNKEKPHLMISGDSSTISAFDIKMINKMGKEKIGDAFNAVNLSHFGTMIELDYYQLKTFVESGRTPHVFILGYPVEFKEVIGVNSRYFLNFQDGLDLFLPMDSWDKVKGFMIYYGSLIIATPAKLVSKIFSPLNLVQPAKLRKDNLGAYYFEETKVSSNLLKESEMPDRKEVIIGKDDVENVEDKLLSPTQKYYLNKIRELCSEHQIKLIYFIFPMDDTGELKVEFDRSYLGKNESILKLPIKYLKLKDGRFLVSGSHAGTQGSAFLTKKILPHLMEVISNAY